MTFRSLRNAPLDLYFLIDFSSSQGLVLNILQRDFSQLGIGGVGVASEGCGWVGLVTRGEARGWRCGKGWGL